MTDKPLWSPSPERVAAAQVTAFMREANARHGLKLQNYRELHAWTVSRPQDFWDLIWDFCGVIGEKGERRLIDAGKMPGAKFFPDAKLNFAENLLRRADGGEAIVFRGEDKAERRLTFVELNALVSRLQQALKAAGIGRGDRVAAMLPNLPETIALMLAARLTSVEIAIKLPAAKPNNRSATVSSSVPFTPARPDPNAKRYTTMRLR